MPIVVKLSHAFYDRFGDDVVDELVGVLNQVDAASHQSLRDLNEANWSRFEDRLARGLAELDAKFTATLRREIAAVDVRIEALDAKLSAQLVTHMRWMIGMWAATMLGLWFKR